MPGAIATLTGGDMIYVTVLTHLSMRRSIVLNLFSVKPQTHSEVFSSIPSFLKMPRESSAIADHESALTN